MNRFNTRAGSALWMVLALVGCGQTQPEPERVRGSGQALKSAPDFVVTAVTGPASAQAGQALTAQVTVCNQGSLSDNADVELYLSADTSIHANTSTGPSEDSFLGGVPVPTLVAGQCVTLPVSGNAYPPKSSTDTAFYLGAVVDPRNTHPELAEDNNATAGNRIGVGSRPDFVVTSVTGPASAASGQSLTAQVTVCNQGTLSDSTDVEVYLSADKTIHANTATSPSEDRLLGSVAVPPLAGGQCTTLPVSGTASPPAASNPSTDTAFYLGAVVDPRNTHPELIEDNNATAGSRLGIGDRPDFIVTAVTGPASAMSGQPITVQATVCNQGTRSDNADVEVYLSADASIHANTSTASSEDRFLGGATVPMLSPGQCTTVAVPSYVALPAASNPSTDTAFYLGAVVDPRNNHLELIEDNNALAGSRMGVGYGPDFVVTAVTGPASAQSGQSLTAQVTVCNQGTASDSTFLEVYVSTDASIHANTYTVPSEDRFLGNASVPTLAAGQCTTLPVSGNAYPPPGPGTPMDTAFYLGAVVDPLDYKHELLEDNNATAGYRLGLGNRADFVVTAVTGPVSAQSGQPLTAQVTVCNQGTLSDSSDVEVYLSADKTIHANTSTGPSEDRLLGSAAVPPLAPGQCTTLPVSGNAYPPAASNPSTDTAFYLGAVVDPRNTRPELIEDNNVTAGSRLGLGNRPDFIVTSVTGPTSAQSGQSITAQVTVCNQGTASDSTLLEVYVSADTTIHAGLYSSSEDRFLGGTSVPTLAPGQCTLLPVSGGAYPPAASNPSTDTAFYLGAVVNPSNSNPELIQDNNATAGSRLGIGNRADFVVTAVTGPASAQGGQSITAQVTVCNQGTLSDSTDVELYLSADASIHANTSTGPSEDRFLGSAPVPTLAPGQCTTLPMSGSAYPPAASNPSTDTAFYLGAVVDPRNTRPELIEDNNATAGSRLGIGNRADFVVTAVTGPASAQSGQSITAQVTVCNQGTLSDSSDVEVYLSADKTIHANTSTGPSEDRLLGGTAVPPLAPGQCTTLPVSGSAYPPTASNPNTDITFYLGAVVDPRNTRPELIEDNNATAGSRLGLGSRPDFVVTAVNSPPSTPNGRPITVQVTVCNQGTLSDSADVEVYLSTDASIHANTSTGPSEDSLVGSAAVPTLAPGQCTTLPVSGYVNAPPPSNPSVDSAVYLGAVVDPRNSRPEFIEDNNVTVSGRLGVGNRADFLITSVVGPASATRGQSLTAQVTVCNQGTVNDGTDVELYLSADASIHANTAAGPSEDRLLGGASTPMLIPNQCITLSISGPAQSPDSAPPGTSYFLGAVADPRNSHPELLKDNNATAGNRLTLN